MTYLDCRKQMHTAERTVQLVNEKNPFALFVLEASLLTFEVALAASPEPRVRARLSTAIKTIRTAV